MSLQQDHIEIGADLPRRRNRLLYLLGRTILRCGGWHLDIRLPNERKLIVLLAPHTSNWDFVFGMAAILCLQIELHWFGKHTLFKGIWERPLRALGGIPVDRGAGGGVVAQTTQAFAQRDSLMIGLAPEGTRSLAPHWKRGFHHMACAAQVPIVLAYLDYRHKRVGTGPLLRMRGDWDTDTHAIFSFYRGITAKRPELFATE